MKVEYVNPVNHTSPARRDIVMGVRSNGEIYNKQHKQEREEESAQLDFLSVLEIAA